MPHRKTSWTASTMGDENRISTTSLRAERNYKAAFVQTVLYIVGGRQQFDNSLIIIGYNVIHLFSNCYQTVIWVCSQKLINPSCKLQRQTAEPKVGKQLPTMQRMTAKLHDEMHAWQRKTAFPVMKRAPSSERERTRNFLKHERIT